MFDELRQQYFPAQLPASVIARPVQDTSQFWAVVGPMLDEVFTPFSELGAYEMPAEREDKSKPLGSAFAQAHHERFIFYDRDQVVGWSYGDMRDRETFFMTNTAILSAYRRKGIYSAFLKQLLSYLEVLGYERVLSAHQTNNRAVIIAKLKARFNITAVTLDERWGAQVELTYLFHEDRQHGYEKAFSLEHW